jgi:hypothetical protein
MKKLFLILLCSLIYTQIWPQKKERIDERLFNISFKGDETVPKTNEKYNKAIDSTFKIARDYTFELRLWSRYLSSNFDNVYILTLKDKKWNARHFGKGIGKFIENPVDQTSVNKLWGLMLNHKVLTLPRYDAIRPRLVKYELDTVNFQGSTSIMGMNDGVLYSFELQTPESRRTYEYSNPKVYFDNYPNIEELYNVVNLVFMVRKFLGKPMYDH